MWTAAVMVCMMNMPITFQSCNVVSSPSKYLTEERCWYEINQWIVKAEKQMTAINNRVVSAKCQGWLERVDAPDVKKEGT